MRFEKEILNALELVRESTNPPDGIIISENSFRNLWIGMYGSDDGFKEFIDSLEEE